jgi:hypothetical protein
MLGEIRRQKVRGVALVPTWAHRLAPRIAPRELEKM